MEDKILIANIIQEFRTLFSHVSEDYDETEKQKEDRLAHWLEMTLRSIGRPN